MSWNHGAIWGMRVKCFHPEVNIPHARLERAKRMRLRVTADAHFFRVLVKLPFSHFENLLMLPTRNPPFLGRGADMRDGKVGRPKLANKN